MGVILIVEDNHKQGADLQKHLSKSNCECKVLHVLNSEEAFKNAIKHNVDLFILDIELPDKSGIELAQEIRRIPRYKFTWIIFVTAFKDLKLQAFEKTQCYYFITKPYIYETVNKKVAELLGYRTVSVEKKEQIFLTIEQKDFIYRINVDEIIYIEKELEYCCIHTYFEKIKIKRLSLKEVYKKLPKESFTQCHKGILVNINYITKIKRDSKTWEIFFLRYNKTIIAGEKYRPNLLNTIEKLDLEEKEDGA